MLEAKLEKLTLSGQGFDFHDDIAHVRTVFSDLLCTSPSTIILSQTNDAEVEVKMWHCFAEVYENEVKAQEQRNRRPLTKEERRQILADALVWAEVTQEHYDQRTASFVTAAHEKDSSFQRIGKMFAEAKQRRGVR